MTEPQSPCVNICEIGEHGLCKGCFRNQDEISDWMFMENEDKQKVLDELSQRRKDYENQDPIDYSIWYEGGTE